MIKAIKVLLLCIIGYIVYSCVSSWIDDNNREDMVNKLSSEYKEALKTDDFEKAHNVLDEIYTFYNDIAGKPEHSMWDGYESFEEKYRPVSILVCDAIKSIYSKEIIYLSSLEEDHWERILYLLSEVKSIGNRYDEDASLEPVDEIYARSYRDYVEAYNSLCNQCLDLAINNGNKSAAQKVMRHYLKNIKKVDWYGGIEYSETDINAAQKKYKEAFEEGDLEHGNE